MTGGVIDGLLQTLVTEHSLVVLWSERSSLRITTVFLGVAVVLGLVGTRSRHRPAWTAIGTPKRPGISGANDWLNYFVLNLPGLVFIGAASLARGLLSISRYAGIVIGGASILLPFYLTQAVEAVYTAHLAELSEPIRAAFNDLGHRIGWRTLELFVGGAVIGIGSAMAKDSSKLFGSLAIIAGAVFLLGVIVAQLVDFANFFLPFGAAAGGSGGGVGYGVFALSLSSGDWWTTARSQVLLFPLYLQALTSAAMPVGLLIGLGIGLYGALRRHSTETVQGISRYASQALTAAPSAFLFSVLLTATAVTIPQTFGAVSNLALSPEFVFWNAIFDALTILVTVWVMRTILNAKRTIGTSPGNPVKAVSGQMQILALAAVLIGIDLIISAAFAVGVILIAGESAAAGLSMREALYILFGLSANGSKIEYGTLFWAMHTTFIPTMILLVALLTSIAVVPIWFIRKLINDTFIGSFRPLMNFVDIIFIVFGIDLSFRILSRIIERVFGDFSSQDWVALAHNLIGVLS